MTAIVLSPTQNQSVTFNFIPCTDKVNKNYAVLQIGLQVWMAENLAWLPAVSPALTGSHSEKHYYVYGYNGNDASAAKATANY